MSREKDPFIRAVAKTAFDTLMNGAAALSAEEIAIAYYNRPIIGDGAISEIRKRLPLIKKLLEKQYKCAVFLVSMPFFTEYRGQEITEDEQAKRCLPTGNGKTAEGIVLATDFNSLLYQTHLALLASRAAGIARGSADRIILAVNAGSLDMVVGAKLLLKCDKPESPELSNDGASIRETLLTSSSPAVDL